MFMRRGEWGPHADYHDLVVNKNGKDEVIIPADYCKKFSTDEEQCPGIDLGCSKIFAKESSIFVTSLWRNHWAILEVNCETKAIKPIAFDSQKSTVLLDMDDEGRMLIKESSLVQAPEISLLSGENKTLVYEYPKIEDQLEYEQGTLKSTDETGESFAFHR